MRIEDYLMWFIGFSFGCLLLAVAYLLIKVGGLF